MWPRRATILEQGAEAVIVDTDRWTVQRSADVAARELGVRPHGRSFPRILRAQRWTSRRPAVPAQERDEAVVPAWVTRDWTALTEALRTTDGTRLLDALAHLACPLDALRLLVWDRRNTHRSAATQAWLRAHAMQHVFLPAYAPEFNPEEQWHRHATPYTVPADGTALSSHARREFRRRGRRPPTLADVFDHAGLPVTLPPSSTVNHGRSNGHIVAISARDS